MMFADAPRFFAVGAILASTIALTINKNRVVRNRTRQIFLAAEMLEQHYEALNIFLSDNDAPFALQKMLIWFSDASADHEAACALTKEIIENSYELKDISPTVQRLLEEMDNLCAAKPELFNVMQICLNAGMMATFLRWQETASMFEQLVTRGTSSPRRELALAASAAKYENARFKEIGFGDDLHPLAA